MNSNFTSRITSARNAITGFLLLLALVLQSTNANSQCSTPTYCTPTVGSLNTYYIGIQNVTMGSINNSTTATGNGPAYSDFTNMSVFSSAGSTISFSIQNGSSNSTMGIIYIDYNQDGTFGTSTPERVWVSSTTTASATVSGSFVVPTGQALGSYRIRVSGDFGGSPSYNPCANNYGEFEDYTLILGSSTPNISVISMLPTTFGVGNNTIIATAKNLSTTTITSLSFGYNCTNGQAPTPTNLTGLSIAAGATYVHTFSTALSLTAGSYTLKVWANNPNGVNPDANPCGDTMTVNACTGLSGSYTINPSGSGASNFTTFNAAISKLAACGVAGPVTLTVASGTYNEQIVIPSIAGASSTNTITIDGVDTSTRSITYNTNGGSQSAVIELNGAKFVTVKNLTISNTYASSPFNTFYGVHLRNLANSNKILGCKITMAATSPPYYYAVPLGICGANYYDSGDNGNNNLVDGNRLLGGYISMALIGSSTLPMSQGNTITNNRMEGGWQYGMYINYQGNFTVEHNSVLMNPSMSSSYGIYAYYLSNTKIDRNEVAAGYYGIMFYTYSYYAGSSNNSVSNNIVRNISSSGYFSGIYMNNGINTTVAHNTVWANQASGNAIISYMSDVNNRINNNIFITTTTGAYAMYIANVSTSYYSSLDWNTLIVPAGSTNMAYMGGSTLSDIPSLKAFNPSFNQNNNAKAPVFVSATDFHLSSAVDQARGKTGLNINIDIDGQARCTFAPSIGADESQYNAGPAVAGYTAPDSVFVNSPASFFNNNPANAPLGHKWYLDGVLVSGNLNYFKMFTSTGSYQLKLVTSSCSGSDSITKTIVVYNPTVKPITDFIADLNVVETYQSVQLTDLSIKGPTYWNWTFIPSAGVNYNNSTTNNSQNPAVSFTNPGLYQVCMWDSNSVGRSVQVCKTAYILVRATNQMCIFPFDTKVASGTLYDDGGPNGNYSSGGTCNFLIDPCASSVNLKFTSFNLTTNSYLRIYNGTSNLAPPLHTSLGFTGTALPGGAAGITATSGKMYIEFVKGTAAPGFAASWTSAAATSAAPTGTLVGPDTVYDCGAYFTKTYLPKNLSFDRDGAYYKWYFDYANSNSFPDVEGKGIYFQDWSYGTIGSYIVRLDIEGCGGVETIYDTIYVDHPTTGPVVDFKADLLTATPNDVVNFTDLSTIDPIWWKWTISGPGSVNSVSGNSGSKNYGVKFTTPGVYTVRLQDSNCVAASSLTKTSYITIIEYCLPAVATLNADFAIERFIFGRADTIINNTVYGLDYSNSSPAVGTVTYRDNTNKFTTYVVNNITIANKAVEAVVGLGESFNFNVKRLSNFNACNFNIWIDWNQDGTFQTSELVASSGVTTGVNYTGSITIPATAKLGYTRLRIGTNFATLSNTPCGINTFGDYNDFRIKVTPDITAPVITIAGNVDTVFVEVGRVFADPGTTVSGATTVTHTGFAYGATVTTYPFLGTHTITASDAAANTAIRNVYVRSTPDITKPVITRTGADTVYSEVGSTYTDLGATATDFYFGSITASIIANSTVNINKIGTYTVTYTVQDAAGNSATPVVRVVIIRDTQIPVITISGPNPIYINVFSTFNPPVATVADNYNTGLTYVISGGPVNTTLLGTYTLFYNAKDSSGNVAATKSLTVIVQDVTAPQLTLVPQDTMIIDCITLTTVPEPGYIVNDNYYPANQITVSKVGTVNLNVLGTYVVRYKATDPSGNVDSSRVRVYKVIDRGAPVITLKGLDIMNWPRWKAFVDPGTNIFDKCDPTATVTADYSKLDINLDGLYEIIYSSTDASGNKAANVKRFVNIYTAVSGINDVNGNNLFMVYPNPNNGKVNVDLNIENAISAIIIVYDANGKVVYSNNEVNPVNNKMTIDLSNAASGMYFVKVVTDNFTAAKSFSIQK